MPNPQAIPDDLRGELEHRIMVEKQPYRRILQWLAGEGHICTYRTLIRQCQRWAISRRGLASDPDVVGYINHQFHTTLNNDNAIATALNHEGHPITPSGVKEIRLSHGWRQHQPTQEQQQEQWENTYALVGQALDDGRARSYGREMLQTALRRQGHRATEDHVRAAIKLHDAEGSEARKPGIKRKKNLKKPVIPGPNHLWSIDGHDKFRNYGIEIYGAIDAYSRRII
jgi:hypothetical protein